jgi:hypothetical protein
MKLQSITLRSERRRENFELITQRPIIQDNLSVGNYITNIAQWYAIELLKVGLMPLRVINYYLIKVDVLDKLFHKLDKNAFDQYEKRQRCQL